MVARLIGLRIALAFSDLRAPARVISVVLVKRFLLLAVAVGTALLPLWLGSADAALIADLDMLIAGTILLVTFTVTLYQPEVLLDPRALAPYPAGATRIFIALTLTSPLTIFGVGAAVWAVIWVVTRAHYSTQTGELISISTVQLVTVLTVAMLGQLLSMRVLSSRKSRVVLRMVGGVLLAAAVPLILFMFLIGDDEARRQTVADLAGTFGLSPFTAVMAASPLATEPTSIGVQLGVQLVTIVLTLVTCALLMTSLLARAWQPTGKERRALRSGWFDVLPATPTTAVAARALTYWRKDARYWVSLIPLPLIPLPVLGVLHFVGVDAELIALVLLPLVMLLTGWTIHNDVAFDATAFWLHVASGLKGWQDRLGRMIPVMIVGVPALLIGGSLSVMVLGDWRQLPTLLAMGFVALAAGAGVSSIMSVTKPYPASRPGESPFVQPAWHGAGAGIAQTVSLFGSALLTLPALWFTVQAQQPVFVVTAIGYGLLLMALGCVIGGAVFDKRASELLLFTMRFD